MNKEGIQPVFGGRKCEFHGCGECDGVMPYHIVFELYARLCPTHAVLATRARRSGIDQIEFLVAMGGDGPDYRKRMRQFIMSETSKKIGMR